MLPGPALDGKTRSLFTYPGREGITLASAWSHGLAERVGVAREQNRNTLDPQGTCA